MILRACAFFFFFLWGWFWIDGDGSRMAAASEGVGGRVEEPGPQWREADQTENAAHGAHRSWTVYLEWNEPGFSGGQIFKEIRATEDSRMTPSLALGSWWGIESEERFTLLNEGGNPLSNAGQKEQSETQPDWRGIGKDTAFFLGYQFAVIGVLYLLPEDVTSWTKDQKRASLDDWWENVQNPVWDKDKWWINYIAHPYWGATFYVRARERGFGEWGSFGYSTLLSCLYEFGIEAFFEPPSYQDLIVTPVGGFLVGKYIFEPIRERIKLKPEREWYDYLTLCLTDPLGAANSFFEWLFGWKSELRLQFRPPASLQQGGLDAPGRSLKEQYGRQFHQHGTGLELKIDWN